MAKEKTVAPSKATAAKTIYKCFELLKAAGGELSRKELLSQMTSTIDFNDSEKELLKSNGQPRWLTVFLFYSIDANKAGYISKNKGNWILTADGEKAMTKGPMGLIDAATEKYRQWDSERKILDNKLTDTGIPEEDINKDKEDEIAIDLIKQQAQESIIGHIERMQWDTFQKLVEALLTAMGHFVDFNAPKGKDGGLDIVAYQDPLGLIKPRIKVQVKHYPKTSVGPEPVRALKGLLHPGEEIGLFVTSGTFTNEAKRTARESTIHMRLIDGEELIELWQINYNRIKDEHKSLLPLQSVYFLGLTEL
jgi:restriction system protein